MTNWIPHNGSKRPVGADTRVVVKHRSGETSDTYIANYGGDDRARMWGWAWRNEQPGDIVAYRLIDDEKAAEERNVYRLQVLLGQQRKLVEFFRSFGCPVCNGDCGSANPPVNFCPMKDHP